MPDNLREKIKEILRQPPQSHKSFLAGWVDEGQIDQILALVKQEKVKAERASEICRATHQQNCSECDDIACIDNPKFKPPESEVEALIAGTICEHFARACEKGIKMPIEYDYKDLARHIHQRMKEAEDGR